MKPEQAFGIVLRKIRLECSMSQEQLALNCDLDRTFISLLERGQRQPSLTTIIQLAASLNISPMTLMQQTMENIDENFKD